MTSTSLHRPRGRAGGSRVAAVTLRVLGAGLLGVSASVHLHQAHRYAFGSPLSGSELFYAQGGAAALVALWLAARGGRPAWWAAVLVGGVSLGAVLLYRYVDVGALGPVPNLYDPIWYGEKTLSAVAEAGVVVVWVAEQARRLLDRRGARG